MCIRDSFGGDHDDALALLGQVGDDAVDLISVSYTHLPEPVRGIRCDSSLIRYVGEYAASVKGISPEEVFRQTAQNAKAVYLSLIHI